MKQNIFSRIDSKLAKMAEELGGVLEKDRPNSPEVLRTFEERRITWETDKIHQGIIIQPNFEAKGVNEKLWNLVITSFHWKSVDRSSFIQNMVSENRFAYIEDNIDVLLDQSIAKLANLEEKDYRLF